MTQQQPGVWLANWVCPDGCSSAAAGRGWLSASRDQRMFPRKSAHRVNAPVLLERVWVAEERLEAAGAGHALLLAGG